MIDFTTLQSLSIPEGVVTQIEDASGRVLWKLSSATNEPAAIFEVAKQVSNTYAGETTYENEEFILIDIYPKKFGTVKVTYGGLTKTITDTSGEEEPNAQQVFFGTFNGVADSVATPASGRLTIEGAYRGYGAGSFTSGVAAGKSTTSYNCKVTNIIDFGSPVYIGSRMFYEYPNAITSLPNGIATIAGYAFYNCTNLALTSLPSGLKSIGKYAFYYCTNLALSSLPSGITSIEDYTFEGCAALALSSLPSGITSIGLRAFYNCSNIRLTSLPDGLTNVGNYAFFGCSGITSLVIPASVVFIGNSSLQCKYDNSLLHANTAFRFLGTTPPDIDYIDSIGSDAFGPSSYSIKGGITVPKGCASVYKAAAGFNNSRRADYIVEAS